MSQENITETILPSGFEITARQLSEMESVDFLLIDIRHAPSANDRLMYHWVTDQG